MKTIIAVLLIAVVLTSGCFHKYEDYKNETIGDKIENFFHGNEKNMTIIAQNSTQTENEEITEETTAEQETEPAQNQTNTTEEKPEAIMKGAFESVNQTTLGLAFIYEYTNGTITLFLDDFWTYYSSSLYVYLSTVSSPTSKASLGINNTEIAKLQNFKGDQTYTIKADPRQYKSVVIYEKSKEIIYGYATIGETKARI